VQNLESVVAIMSDNFFDASKCMIGHLQWNGYTGTDHDNIISYLFQICQIRLGCL